MSPWEDEDDEELWEDEDDLWEEDEEEDDDEEEDEAQPVIAGPGLGVDAPVLRSVSLGFLACLPLLIAYEAALIQAGPGWRGTAELLALRALEPLGGAVPWVRRGLVLALGVTAAVALVRRGQGALPAVMRVVLEGAAAAACLGPALVGLLLLSGVGAGALPPVPDSTPPGSLGLLVLGAAAWEEILFRLLAYGAVYVLALPLVRYLGAPRGVDRWITEALALVGQAFLFAAAHVASFVEPLGGYGEPFDAAAFPYRMLAGILLGLLLRWRGLGVAAWAHGIFNLALLLGAGPQVYP